LVLPPLAGFLRGWPATKSVPESVDALRENEEATPRHSESSQEPFGLVDDDEDRKTIRRVTSDANIKSEQYKTASGASAGMEQGTEEKLGSIIPTPPSKTQPSHTNTVS